MSHVIGRGRYAKETYPRSPGSGGGSVGCQSAVVFSPDPPCTPTTTIRSDRSVHQSPITGSPVGATNLGSDTSGTSTGVSADYATVSGGDQGVAAALGATVVGGVGSEALGAVAIAGGDECIASNLAIALGVESIGAGTAAVALGLTADGFGGESTAISAAQATGDGSVAIGPSNVAGTGVFSFTIAAGGTLVTIAGVDATGAFRNGDSLTIQPITPKFTAATSILTVATPPVFAAGDTTFNISAPIDTTTTAGEIADTTLGTNAVAIGGTSNSAQGTESSIVGGLGNQTTLDATSSRAGGTLAKAIRPTQDAWASGSDGITPGAIQTSKLVLNGSTPGAAPGESTDLLIDSATFFELEDNKGYTIRITAIALGVLGGNRVAQSFDILVTAHREAGTTTISASNTISQQGDAAAASWTMAAILGAAPDRIRVNFTTGATTAETQIAARVEFTEVLLFIPPT